MDKYYLVTVKDSYKSATVVVNSNEYRSLGRFHTMFKIVKQLDIDHDTYQKIKDYFNGDDDATAILALLSLTGNFGEQYYDVENMFELKLLLKIVNHLKDPKFVLANELNLEITYEEKCGARDNFLSEYIPYTFWSKYHIIIDCGPGYYKGKTEIIVFPNEFVSDRDQYQSVLDDIPQVIKSVQQTGTAERVYFNSISVVEQRNILYEIVKQLPHGLDVSLDGVVYTTY